MKRYHVQTFGCQMNAHDSERMKGVLESLGLGEAADPADADVLVFNTCTIREKADDRFVAHLMEARAAKRRDPDKRIVVGGCWSESMKDELFELYPFVDLAFGPGHISKLAEVIGPGGDLGVGHFSTFDEFSGHLPLKRERRFQAWMQISQGCNSKCSYCIVPSVRGREQSRRAADLIAEATTLAADGVRELTLLGQNVNSWGRDLPPDERLGFGGLLRALDAVDGIERIRFTSPHPKDMRDDVIAAMRDCAAVCEQLHLPLQSGSTRVLKAMRRTYSRDRYLALVERIREAVPDMALTTDIIVGFPGETEADFQETLEVVDAVGYDHAFTFVYSPRRGTEAAAMPDQVPEDVKRERIERLIDLVQAHAARRNARAGGQRAGGAGRGAEPHRRRAAARPHARQQDRQLPRRRRGRRPGGRADRAIDVADARRPRGHRARSRPDVRARVVALFGPTASGKSGAAIALAARTGGEIVSCDAMQLYRGLPVLTNQPTADELAAAPAPPGRRLGAGARGLGRRVRVDGPCGRGRRAGARPAADRRRRQRPLPAGGAGRAGPAAGAAARPARADRAPLRRAGRRGRACRARTPRPRRRGGRPPERPPARRPRARAGRAGVVTGAGGGRAVVVGGPPRDGRLRPGRAP